MKPFTLYQYADFVATYKVPLEEDFSREKNLSKFMEKLKKWITKLQLIEDQLPKKLHLEELSPFLVEFQNNTIEIPGQYFEVLVFIIIA